MSGQSAAAPGEPLCYPFPGDTRLDLDPRYAMLRAREPVSRVRMPNSQLAWLIARYDDIRAILSDPRFRRSLVDGQDMTAATRKLAGKTRSVVLPMTDPPGHTEVRRLVGKGFSARRMEKLRPRAEAVVDRLLTDMRAAGPPADLVRQLALPLPVTMITELLGVPQPDHGRVRAWSEATMSVTAIPDADVQAAKAQLTEYMTGVVAGRVRHPADDFVSDLVRATGDGGQLTEEELLSVVMLLFVAGYETTVTQLSNFTYTLLTNPGRWAELCADPALVPQAIEELLRFVPVGFSGMPIRAAEDVRYHGRLIRAGDFVLLPKASGNRDQAAFDRPDELDFSRGLVPHIAFGHGIHYCLGAPLARLEFQVAIGALVRRFPTLRLATSSDEELRWRQGVLVRGPRVLPVAW